MRVAGAAAVGTLIVTAAAVVTLAAFDGTFDTGARAAVRAQRTVDHPRTFSIVAVGDWLSENRMNDAAIANARPGVRMDHTPLLAPIEPIIRSATLAICHMETPITAPGARYGWMGQARPGGPTLIGAPNEVAGDLARVGFDRCSTASNHSWDLGATGIATTLDALDAAGITHVGTARSPAEAATVLLDVRGVRLAHLAYTRTSNTGFPREGWRVNHDTGAIAGDVAAARAAGAEIVIVSLHVPTEMLRAPTPDDRALVTGLTAVADVDLVIVHGPHTIQPLEVLDGTPVFWSLGNFVSGMGAPTSGRYADPRTLDGLMATARFTERPGGGFAVEAAPLLLCQMFGSRVVHPGIAAIADAATPPGDLAGIGACLDRSLPVVPDAR